jgi:ABC-type multidrug transport system fused ATPase/permease subunit
MFLSLAAAFFEGISLGLLVPVTKGIIEMDFGFARDLPLVKDLIAKFPQLFIKPNSSVFILLVGIIFAAAVIKNILLYFSSMGVDYQARKASSSMRKMVMDRYLSFGKLFFDRSSQGILYTRLVTFTDAIALQLKALYDVFKWVFLLVTYSTLMFVISWKLTIFTIVVPPIIFYSSNWLIVKIKKTSKYYAEAKSMVNRAVHNMLSCLPLIKLYTSEKKELQNYSYTSDRLATFEFSMDKKARLINPLQEIVLMVIVLLLISTMGYLVIKERTGEISAFLVYFYLIRRAAAAVMTITSVGSSLAKTSGPREELLKIFDDSDKIFVPEGKKECGGLKRSIEFNHLNFSYIPEVQVLEGVTFTIEKGKITAIVGATGAGKTTLVNLLMRFYDCSSSTILIDGVDIREFTLESLRAHMAFVNQEILLFDDTLKMNITYGAGKVTDEKLVDVAKKARLYDFIMSLPNGFDTLIGERGVKLSGGEKQRTAIARALLKGSEILILDEATSSLDSLTERLIQEAIEEAIKDRTAVIIAHRLSTIRNADKIVVIEDGRVAEQGSLTELMERKGKFWEYWEEQKFF